MAQYTCAEKTKYNDRLHMMPIIHTGVRKSSFLVPPFWCLRFGNIKKK